MTRNRFSLIWSVLIAAIIGICLPGILFTAYNVHHEREFIEKSHQQQAQEILSLASLGLEEPLWNFSPELTASVVNSLFIDPDMLSVKVFDQGDKVFFEKKRDSTSTASSVPQGGTFSKDILRKGERIGHVEIVLSNENVRAQMRKESFRAFVGGGLLSSFILLLFAIFLRRIFLFPIRKLVSQVDALAADPKISQNTLRDSNELGTLSRSIESARIKIDHLMNEVEAQKMELEKINAGLEVSIQEKSLQMTAQSKLATLGEMAGSIAHEINNPLAIIQGNLEMTLKKAPLAPTDRVRLDRAYTMATRISAIVKGLKTFSRDGRNDPFAEHSLKEIVDDVLSMCGEKMKAAQIEIQNNIHVASVIECRSVQLGQVILNIMHNAHDAIAKNPEPRWIRCDLVDHADYFELRLTDSGLGIPPAVVQKIFDPFFTTKEVGKGTGLGMSVSKGIMNSHNGKIYVDAAAKNTCFVIEVPKKQPSSPATWAA